jgi:uncharacterized protein (DUF2141 family)
MLKNKALYFYLLLLTITIGCAKRGTITGGDKDTIAPVLNSSFPKNFSTNFNGNEIKLVFDEYVKLKNANKQLVISPPMKNQPIILPSNASKVLTIKLKDTLLPNTTYSFNFGQSIEDNNEGNPYSQFKYVFSTGTYIDSLALNVKIKDALEKKTDNFVSVMLYEVNEKYNDSTIYKESPRYITNSLDSLKVVKLENIKAGKYQLIALKDNGNNKYNPKTDKIGFQKQFITIPNDTVFEVELFKEIVPFKAIKPAQAAKSRLLMGYEGQTKGVKITVKNGTEIIPNVVTNFPKKDSLQIWYKHTKADSLEVAVEKENYSKKFIVKIKNQKADTLTIKPEYYGTLPLRERFAMKSSVPLIKVDKSKMELFNKDSIAVPFETEYDELNQMVYLNFKKEPLEKYKINILPGAFEDFYETQNDTLKFSVGTKNLTDYGNLRVQLENVKRFPVIIELTDKEGKIKATEYSEANTTITFDALEPALYTLRVIYDDNKNKMWDTGNFIEKKQSEEVIYFPKEIDVRSNWDVEQPFNLKE